MTASARMTPLHVEAACSRCGETRWPVAPLPDPFVCYRCRAVLVGWNADDPKPSAAQAAARAAAAARLRHFRLDNPATETTGEPETSPSPVTPGNAKG